MRVLFFLLITIFISSAQAAVDVCLDKASVDEIVAEFPFQEIAANGKKLDPRQDVKVDLCDSSSLSYKIAEALLFIKNLPALKSRGDIFDTGFLGASPFQFIKDRIPSIYFESVEEAATSTCDKYTVAVASIDGSLHICPDSVNYSKIYLSGAMVHESRHFDGNIFEHQICTRGPESILGQFACDQN